MAAFKKVLYIDDDVITITIYTRTMKICNFCEEVVPCSNGKQAKEFLIANKDALPDVIFLDINMHVMTGWEFIDWFQNWAGASGIDIPVYMVSSSISKEDADRAKTYKLVHGYIAKPITLDYLNKIVAENKPA